MHANMKELSRGTKFYLPSDGDQYSRLEELPIGMPSSQSLFLCLPVAYVADQLEAWNVLNTTSNGTFPDTSTMVEKKQLTSSQLKPKKRSLLATKKVGRIFIPSFGYSIAWHVKSSIEVLFCL